MKRTFICCFYILCFGSYMASGQQTGSAQTPEQRAEMQAGVVSEILQLSPQKKRSIYQAALQAEQEVSAIPAEATTADKKALISQIRQRCEARYRDILGADRYRSLQESRQPRAPEPVSPVQEQVRVMKPAEPKVEAKPASGQ